MNIPSEQVDQANEQSPRRDLYLSCSDVDLSKRKKKKLIEALDEIYGFDLPLIFSMLLESKIEGYLNIVSEDNEISGVAFVSNGIAKVDLSDKESLFGNLIVAEGLLTKNELDEILKNQQQQVGEALIQQKKLTVQQMSDLLLKQMRLRLSKYISNKKFRINFVENSSQTSLIAIGIESYLHLAHDWVIGRFSDEWLKNNYFEWENDYIVWNSKKDDSGLTSLQIFETEADLLNIFKSKNKVYDLIEKNRSRSSMIYKIMHLLLCFGYLSLEKNTEASDQEKNSQIKRIYSILKDKKGAQLLVSMSDIVKCSSDNYETVYNLFNEIINVNVSEADMFHKNELVKMSLDVLMNGKKYLQIINQNSLAAAGSSKATGPTYAKEKIDTNSIRKSIVEGDYFNSFIKLKELNRSIDPIPKVRLYMLWSKMASMAFGNNKFGIKDLEKDLLQILPEDKYTADYYYVLGLLGLIKNDKKLVEQNYLQAVRQDAFFRNYPIRKPGLLTKIKSYVGLKSAILIFLSLTSYPYETYANTSQPSNNPATEKKVYETPPIALLNQYYQYEINANNELLLSGRNVNPNLLILQKSNKSIAINITSLTEYIDKNFILYFINSKNEILWKKNYEKGEVNFNFPIKFSTQNYICFETRNLYSQINICRNLLSTKNSQSDKLTVTVDNQKLDDKGVVVLKSSQSNVTFDVWYPNTDYIRILAKRRPIVVAKIRKDADDRSLNVQFLEDRRGGIAWFTDLSLDTTTVDLPADKILRYKQDIYFTDPDLQSKAINGTYADLLRYGIVVNNKIGIEVMIFYNEVMGSGANIVAAELISDLSFGIRFFYQNNLDEKQEWYVSGSFYTTKVRDEQNLVSIENQSQSFAHLFGGYKYHFSGDWALAGEVALKQELFFIPNLSTNGVTLLTGLNKVISVVPEWTTIDSRKWNLITFLGLRYILPGNSSGSSLKTGTQYDVNFRFSYKLNWGRLFASAQYGKRDQGIDDVKISEQYVNGSLGFYYLF